MTVFVLQEQAEEVAREELIRNHFSARIADSILKYAVEFYVCAHYNMCSFY